VSFQSRFHRAPLTSSGGHQGVQTGFGTTSYTTEVFSEYFAYVAKDNVLIEMGGGNQFELQAAAVAKKVYQRA
jgi:hypothetical protein